MERTLEIRMKKISLEIAGKKTEGFVEKVERNIWIHVHGKTFIAEDTSTKKRVGKHAVLNPHEIRAAMPGKITAVKKKTNDPVAVGETIIVMEAMKMEYSLKASMSGFIRTLSLKVGEQVTAGQLLAEIKEEKNEKN